MLSKGDTIEPEQKINKKISCILLPSFRVFFCPLQRTKKVFVDWWLVIPQMNYVTSGDDLLHFKIESLVSVEFG